MNLSTVEAFKWIRPKNGKVLTEEELQRLQETLAQMLSDVMAVSEELGIKPLMGGGSCLGAVRHQGFIPWDDDIDLNMTGADLEVFLPAFEKRFGDRYWVHTAQRTKGYGLTFPRILKKGTSVRTREDFHNDECGAFIDIFPIENTFDAKPLRTLHGVLCMGFGFLQSCRKFYRDRKELLAMCEGTEEGAKYAAVFRKKIAVGTLLAPIPLDVWTRWTSAVYGLCRRETGWVSVPSGKGHFFGELCRRETFFPVKEAVFGGTRVYVPADADAYLTRLYGEWKVPPEAGHVEKHVFFEPFKL